MYRLFRRELAFVLLLVTAWYMLLGVDGHSVLLTVVVYRVIATAIHALPVPDRARLPGYAWLYDFTHGLLLPGGTEREREFIEVAGDVLERR